VTRTVFPDIDPGEEFIESILPERSGRYDRPGMVPPWRLALLCAALWILRAGAALGSETDNLTYRYLPLEDSASKFNRMANETLDLVLQQTNEKLRPRGEPLGIGDTEVELTFAKTYVETVIRRFGDRLLPALETCVEKNDCAGWPRFERIVLTPGESIYGEARYNRVAIAFLAP